jgi:hypothetical protein
LANAVQQHSNIIKAVAITTPFILIHPYTLLSIRRIYLKGI